MILQSDNFLSDACQHIECWVVMFVVFYYLCIDTMVNKQINQLVADSSVKNNARKPMAKKKLEQKESDIIIVWNEDF